MSIKKVWLDESNNECSSCSVCETLAPEIFEIPDKMVVKENADFNKYEKEIKDACDSCPTEVIKFE